MEPEDKKLLIANTNRILSEIESIDKKRDELITELKETFPIKVDDKVEIRNRETDELLRYAYVYKINVELRGIERKAGIEFDLVKCKKDGVRSHITDSFKPYKEYIKRIK